MYSFIKGIIDEITSTSVIIDCHGVGYEVFTPNPYSFNEGEEVKVYVYFHIREDEQSLYGFKKKEEKELFLQLINVKGLGPKMALPIIAMGSINGIADAINRENLLYLKKFPKIGDKVARQIILDLKGKLVSKKEVNVVMDDELTEALLALGYKNADISKIIPKINSELTIEEKIKEALKLLLK